MIVLMFGRALMLIVSYKYLPITKFMVYYQLLLALVTEIGLPLDMGTYAQEFVQVDLLISFILDYFSFYPTTACIILVQASQLPATSLLYGKEITAKLTISIISGCFW